MSRPELLRDLDRDSGWTLLVDGAEQSYVDVADAAHLEFEYMQHVAVIVDAVFSAPVALSALHLGGGAFSLPRWLAATRPGSNQLVVERSAEILAAVEPLGPVVGCSVVNADASDTLVRLEAASFDLVIWDLYDGPRAVVSALTMNDVTHMHRVLRPGGIVVINLCDARPFDIVRPVTAALRELFADVLVLTEPRTLRGRRSGNCLLVGGAGNLPADDIVRVAASAPVRGHVLAHGALTRFVAGAHPPTTEQPLPEPSEALGRGFL